MLLTCIDPALLLYRKDHWQTGQAHSFSRIRALSLHRKHIRKFNQQLAISDSIRAIVYECFPWNASYKSIPELHDFRQFVLDDLGRAQSVEGPTRAIDVQLHPNTLTCMHLDSPAAVDCWKEFLGNCIAERAISAIDFQIATWPQPVEQAGTKEPTLTITCHSRKETCSLPIVYDEESWLASWARHLVFEDQWPDLQICVKLYYQSDSAMQRYGEAREPIQFECTTGFLKSVENRCQPRIRPLLVKAIAKKIYGIFDSGLRDEPFESVRRFRVDNFWRVHYREHGDKIVLEEFGPHDMGH